MQVKSIAECSKGSILQYFRPSLSYHLSLRSWFCLFFSGCFTQDLLFVSVPATSEISIFLLVYVDEQAGLSMIWLDTREDRFSHVEAQIKLDIS